MFCSILSYEIWAEFCMLQNFAKISLENFAEMDFATQKFMFSSCLVQTQGRREGSKYATHCALNYTPSPLLLMHTWTVSPLVFRAEFFSGTLTMVPSTILSIPCWTPSPPTSRSWWMPGTAPILSTCRDRPGIRMTKRSCHHLGQPETWITGSKFRSERKMNYAMKPSFQKTNRTK